jgi:hypothetical protein
MWVEASRPFLALADFASASRRYAGGCCIADLSDDERRALLLLIDAA